MLWWKKVKNWCFHHWRLLVVAGIALAAFLVGRRNSAKYKLQASLINDRYRAEKKALEELNGKKENSKKEAVDAYKRATLAADKRLREANNDLDKRRAQRVRELVEENKEDSKTIDSILYKEFGIRTENK
jgi:hypothetical protein